MSVYCKSKCWYYQFTKNGNPYRGKCENCKTEKQAKIYENKEKLKTDELDIQADKIKYLEKQIDELRGSQFIRLDDGINLAFELSHRKKNERTTKQLVCYWNDFVLFVIDKYKIQKMHQVKKEYAMAYMRYVATHGRYNSTVRYNYHTTGERISYNSKRLLSPRTVISLI